MDQQEIWNILYMHCCVIIIAGINAENGLEKDSYSQKVKVFVLFISPMNTKAWFRWSW